MVAKTDDYLRQDLTNWMKQNMIPTRRLASMLDVSAPRLSQWLGGKYPGDNKRIASAVSAFLRRQREREQQMRSRHEEQFIPTSVARRVSAVASLAHDEGDICVCVSVTPVAERQWP